MVRFDGDRRPARKADRFDHVGVKRALGKEFCPLDAARVFLEHVDEQATDDFALGLGVGNPLKLAKEQIRFVGMDQRDVVVVAEHRHDLLRLVQPQQTMIDEDAGQLIANRLMDQDRRDRGIDAARQPANHPLVANLFADFADRFLAIRAHRPVALEPCEPHEILIELGAARGVVNLRVELHRIEVPCRVGGNRKRRVGRGAVHLKPRRDFADMVSVRHPYQLASLSEPARQHRQLGVSWRDKGAAKLGGAVATFDLAAKAMHHHLLAVANSQDRHAERENRGWRHWRALGKDRGRAARKYHRLGGEVLEEGIRDLLERMNFAIDVQFPQAARDQLRHLRAEVDDQKAVMLCHVRGILCPAGARKRNGASGDRCPHPSGYFGAENAQVRDATGQLSVFHLKRRNPVTGVPRKR
ncbi:hypothetical protein GALL_427340 [mine drainage metagenome]|uniref:Uncharacterized protein n=1 Tax=mine drainage metagenome TaxID=410659 RepID=A0A1J5PVJ9_9ZZZZ